MSTLRATILGWVVLMAIVCGGQALAVPPVLAPPAAQALVADYMKAVAANDVAAYAKLFAPEAEIVSDRPRAAGPDAWLRAVSPEFAPTRRVNFLAVFSRLVQRDGRSATRVLLVQEIRDCRPGIIECFGQFRSETLTVQNGLIVALERSHFTHRLTEPGGWTFFAP
jgi:hypothetical protein